MLAKARRSMPHILRDDEGGSFRLLRRLWLRRVLSALRSSSGEPLLLLHLRDRRAIVVASFVCLLELHITSCVKC